MKKLFLAAILSIILPAAAVQAAPKNDKDLKPMSDSLSSYLIGRTGVDSPVRVLRAIVLKDGTLRLIISRSLLDHPLREQEIRDIRSIARKLLPKKYAGYHNKFSIYSDNKPIEYYKSRYFTEQPDRKAVEEHRKFRGEAQAKVPAPLITRRSSPNKPSAGLQGRHIALWQSHGWYYEQSLKRWEWQRARMFETVEDLYTQSYVVPFLAPMLENAGAVVLMPRERDWNTIEVIVDNDDQPSDYSESGRWTAAPDTGFANPKASYLYQENPFRMGTARMSRTEREGKDMARWIPDIPEDGEYAVYVSYQTVERSTYAAQYEVRHMGGSTRFSVNQQMGGRMWVYLGRFPFMKGRHTNQGVFLSNIGDGYSYVTADAVKFGGGMGNMARKPAPEELEEDDFDVEPETSGYPRFTEGARYWLQWSGFNDTIYSHTLNLSDVNDDFMSRGKWVNILSDGSVVKPGRKGYNIPVDLSFAFHSDAGTTLNDSIVGTLSIYTRLSNDQEKYPDGEDRILGREYADIVQSQIVDDIRALWEPEWTRRYLWDRQYAESRMPEVPGMLLELLSHQNLADMRYGLDPAFRFTVSRSIYKGMLKFLAWLNDFEYTVQPLPVNSFEAQMEGGNAVLRWAPTPDPLEATAETDGYILYTRIDDGGFDNGVALDRPHTSVPVEPGHIYHFRVSATNAGGESFPSETLSVGMVSKKAPTVLIINNFDRVSAPVSFASADSTIAGFYNRLESGVAWGTDISYTGDQYEFRRSIPWMDDDSPGFGSSDSDFETKALAGNTFDYPAVHGKAWMAAGCNFVSVSHAAVENGRVPADRYPIVDLICGKQLTTQVGRKGAGALRYQVFPEALRRQLSAFAEKGSSILVSGAHVGSDLWEPVFVFPVDSAYRADYLTPAQEFAKEVLHYRWRTNNATNSGKVRTIENPLGFQAGASYSFNPAPNERVYGVESPDGLIPDGEGAFTVFRYSSNNIPAGVAYKGEYRTVVLGFPIEVLETREQIEQLIGEIARFFGH